MNEKITISRLSVFLAGATVFTVGIFHTYPHGIYWLSFIISASLSFISGLLFRRNETPYKTKLVLFMIPHLFMFVFFYLYFPDIPGILPVIFISSILLMFVAGLKIDLKQKKTKSAVLLFTSLIFIAGSYFYFPAIMFYCSEKEANIKVPDFEIQDSEGIGFTKDDFKGKVLCVVFNPEYACEINKKIKQLPDINNNVAIATVIEKNKMFHNPEKLKDYKQKYNFDFKLYYDGKNYFENIFAKMPYVFIADKEMKIRYVYDIEYFYKGNFFYKKISERIKMLTATTLN